MITGSPLIAQEFNEAVFTSPQWESTIIDVKRIHLHPIRYLKVLQAIRKADGWLHIGGHTLDYFHRLGLLSVARWTQTPCVIRWMGSDILSMAHLIRTRPRVLAAAQAHTHWCNAPWQVEELSAIGFRPHFMPLTSRRLLAYQADDIPPLPEEFTILTYIRDAQPALYGWDHLQRLASDFPQIRFRVLRGGKETSGAKPQNMEFLGWVTDMRPIYANSSLLVRMTSHDGFAHMVHEALLLGRHVIWTYPFPGVLQVQSYAELAAQVQRLLALHQKGLLSPNREGREHIETHFHPQELAERCRTQMASLISSYSKHKPR